jgi:uncharacterized protein YndB with AHSA1/START domain
MNETSYQRKEQKMATATITPNQDAVVCEIHIAAPPERVFQALIDPKQVMRWWTSEKCEVEAFSIEPRLGGRWSYDTKQTTMNVNGVSKFHCDGEVLEYDPPRLLVWSWISNAQEDISQRTVVRWELTPQSGGTQLRVTHTGLAQMPTSRESYAGGWPGVLGLLKDFFEKQ